MPLDVNAPKTIELARSIPDAKGLEEIKDPFLKAKIADALDVSRDAAAMQDLATTLAKKYPRAAERVQKQATYLAKVQQKPIVLSVGNR